MVYPHSGKCAFRWKMVAPMSLKTFGFSAVARALAATAVLGFGMAAAPSAYAGTPAEDTAALATAIANVLNNPGTKDAAELRKEIAALISSPDYQNANVQTAFNTAKVSADARINPAQTSTYSQQAFLAVTEVQRSITFATSASTAASGGNGGNTGGAAISNTTIGGAVAAGGHSGN